MNANNNDNTKGREIKKRFVHEARLFTLYASFLALFFCAFTLYRSLILKEYHIGFVHYGYAIVEALILAKVILLGQMVHLGERFSNRSLIYPTIYKASVFALFALVFSIIEHFFMGYLHGKPFSEVYEKLAAIGIYQILAQILIVYIVFVLFFAFLELGRVYGEKSLYLLFLHRKKLQEQGVDSSSEKL